MEQVSLDKEQENVMYTVSELRLRLVHMEELFQELSSDHTELSNKVAQTLAKSNLEGESLRYRHEHFPHSYLRDMMSSLSMPGMKFIGGNGRPWLHSFLWIVIHIGSLLISYVYIKEEYDNWMNSPVVKTVSNNLTYVKEIPFPAITVCLPGSVSNDYDFAGAISKCMACTSINDRNKCYFNKMCSYEEKVTISVAFLICPYRDYNVIVPWTLFDQLFSTSMRGKDFSMYSKIVFPHCNVEMKQHRVVNVLSWRKFLFRSIRGCDGNNYLKFISNFGMCFTINGVREEDIFKENTVIFSKKMSVLDNVPWEGLYKGKGFTLENMIYLNGDFNTTPAYISDLHQITLSFTDIRNESVTHCNIQKANLKDAYFAIHNPVEVPFIFNNNFDLKFGEAKEIRVMPEMVITEKGLENYKPMDRGCFYSYERELAMFKKYSENNCKTECAANCSLQHCACVPYYLPRHNSSVRVCMPECYKALVCDREACSCLPDCYSLSYDFEIVKVTNSTGREGSIEMNFKTTGFYATVRVSLTNLAQFLAYCLGIAGVFNGFSVMVIFEIFYFFTFRLWNSLKSYFK